MAESVYATDLKSVGEIHVGSTPTARTIFELYPRYNKIYGPYVRKEDGRAIVILYDGKRRTAKLYARVLLEMKLGRRLTASETVDHIDGDVTNDKVGNLQVLSRQDNVKKSNPIRCQQFSCPQCSAGFILSGLQLSRALSNRKSKEGSGPFCNRKCAGAYNTKKT